MNKLSKKVNLLVVLSLLLSMMGVAYAAKIKAGDAIQISLKGVPIAEQQKVNGQYRVRDSGNIRIPMINVNIQAAGKKPEQVERSIEEAFKKAQIYSAPTISLQVLEGEKKVIQLVLSVGGQIKRPGRVQYRDGMTLAEAIQQAGDRTTFASKYLYLTRKNKAGELTRQKLNFTNPKVQSIKVLPNDVIVVPQKGALIDRG